jgi:cytochrome P450
MSSSMEKAPALNLASAVFKANPYPTFASLRLDDPVHLLSASAGQQTWLLTRYQEAEAALRDERFVKDPRNALLSGEQRERPPAAADLVSMGMVDFDPPNHTRLRSLVAPFFTARRIEQWQERIQQVTDALIDAFEDNGKLDLIDAFAFPLPLTVISDMLGIPDGDRPALHQWTKLLAEAFDHPGTLQQADEPLQDFYNYLLELIERKRQEPGDGLINQLIQAKDDQLSARELVAMVFLLITAGHDTTDNLIGSGMYALLTHPEQLALLRGNPALIKTAIEEFLRYYSPFMLATRRWARVDVELAGKLIRRGDQVAISLAAANRDGTTFVAPDGLDITRAENHHLSFGKGIHYCIGAPLARLEGQIAIRTLLRRLPNLHLEVDPASLTWRPGSFIIGLSHLPVAF